MAHQRRAEFLSRFRTHGVRRGRGDATSAENRPQFVTCDIVDGIAQPPAIEYSMPVDAAPGSPHRVTRTIIPAPTPEVIAQLTEAWRLHPLLAEDLLHARQRPKIERYGDTLFVVLRAAHYIDEHEEVQFSEFHLLMRPDALVILCQDGRLIDGTPIPARLRSADEASFGTDALAADQHLLRLGPEAMVYRLLDAVVDGYFSVLSGLQTDKDQIERQVFSGDALAAQRIYHLSQEVIDVLQATTGLTRLTQGLRAGQARYDIAEELQTYLQDVSDHLARVVGETAELRDTLSQILSVNATLVAQRQNEDMKKISGWAAILFAPTLVGAVYGMNFDTMPELHWLLGYPMAIGLMVALAVVLYVVFKVKKWM